MYRLETISKTTKYHFCAFEMLWYRRMLMIKWTDRIINVIVLRRMNIKEKLFRNSQRRPVEEVAWWQSGRKKRTEETPSTFQIAHILNWCSQETTQDGATIQFKRNNIAKLFSWLKVTFYKKSLQHGCSRILHLGELYFPPQWAWRLRKQSIFAYWDVDVFEYFCIEIAIAWHI